MELNSVSSAAFKQMQTKANCLLPITLWVRRIKRKDQCKQERGDKGALVTAPATEFHSFPSHNLSVCLLVHIIMYTEYSETKVIESCKLN